MISHSIVGDFCGPKLRSPGRQIFHLRHRSCPALFTLRLVRSSVFVVGDGRHAVFHFLSNGPIPLGIIFKIDQNKSRFTN